MENSRQAVTKRYLTIVPTISGTLDGPAYGGDDREDACDPMTAIKHPDRLNYTRGSGARVGVIGNLIRIWLTSIYLGIPRILKMDNQGVDRTGGQMDRTCKQRRADAIHRRRSRYLGRCSRPETAAAGIERTVIHCLFLCGSAVSRRGDGVEDGTDRPSYSHCRWA